MEQAQPSLLLRLRIWLNSPHRKERFECVASFAIGAIYSCLFYAFLFGSIIGIPLAAVYGHLDAPSWMYNRPHHIENIYGIFTSWLIHHNIAHLRFNLSIGCLMWAALTIILLPTDPIGSCLIKPWRETRKASGLFRSHFLVPIVFTILAIPTLGVLSEAACWIINTDHFINADGQTIYVRSCGFSGVVCSIGGILTAITLITIVSKDYKTWRWWPAAVVTCCFIAGIITEDLPFLWTPPSPDLNGIYTNHKSHLIGLSLGLGIGLLLSKIPRLRRLIFPKLTMDDGNTTCPSVGNGVGK